MFLYINKEIKTRNNNATFKGEQRDNVNKAKPPRTFSCCCRKISSTRKPWGGGGIKSAAGSDF